MSGRRVPGTSMLAVNPIAYWLVGGKIDRSEAVLEAAFAELSRMGFAAVKADVPSGMATDAYLGWIGSYGLAPSVSLFNSAFDETVDMAIELDRARRFAAEQAALGLDRAMVSSVMVRARMAQPGIGADFSEDRFQRCLANVHLVCEVFREQGVRALLHNHIGGVFETAGEVDRVLASIHPDLLGFGPDTGHLRWAGADPAEVIARYAPRMGAIHLKDVLPDLLEPADRRGLSYLAATSSKRVWAEPGWGVIDFAAVLDAMPRDYDGDYMIEVDEPSIDDRSESMRRCHHWAVESLASRVDLSSAAGGQP